MLGTIIIVSGTHTVNVRKFLKGDCGNCWNGREGTHKDVEVTKNEVEKLIR